VAVIGPNANLSKAVAGYYGGNTCGGKYWNMVDAVQQYVPKTVSALGVPTVTSDDTSGIAAAADLAKDADAVVLVLGTDLSVAREGRDAVSIAVPDGQKKLIAAVTAAASKPVVVVMLSAVPLDISDLAADPKVGAILHLGQPSVQTLGAGDVLFGKKVPAGRTIQTVYPASYAAGISIFDFNMRPGPSSWPRPDCPKSDWGHCKNGTNPGRTHRFYTGKAVYPFGFGLSYTSFKYEVVSEPKSSVSLAPLRRHLADAKGSIAGKFLKASDIEALGPAASYAVKVTNTGHLDADDVVLGFLTPPGAGKNGIPLQTLFGFERVHVKAGETVTVWLYPAFSDFSQSQLSGDRYALAGEYRVHFGVSATSGQGMGFAESRLVTHSGEEETLVV